MLYAVLVAVNIFLSLVQFSVVIECVCSWIPEITNTSFYDFIYRLNGSFLNPIRKIQYKLLPGLPIDVSPIILFAIIGAVRGML